jgi:hypothetical protein
MIPSQSTSGTPPKGQFKYPNVAFTSDMDYVLFTFYKYKAPFSSESDVTAGQGLNQYNSSTRGMEATGATVALYMPEDMEGEYGAQWQDQNFSNMAIGALGSFGGAAGGNAGKGFGSILGAISVATSNAFTKGTVAANAISGALGAANFGTVTVNDIFASTTGQVLNPNTEVLYKGPKMRNFSLKFKMAPRNSDEAEQIKKIIHAFKFATLPTYGGRGDDNMSFVKVPQIVDVTFKKGSNDHDWVTQFKPSVITGFQVSYTPDGAWATLPNGSPVATQISITFQELKMVYADELKDSGASY